jgi:hypothetical protein
MPIIFTSESPPGLLILYPKVPKRISSRGREILNVSGEQIFTRRLTSLDLEENQARRLTRRAGANPNRSAPLWRQLLRKALGSEERNQPSFNANQPFARRKKRQKLI